MQFVLFDLSDNPIGICQTRGAAEPAASTMQRRRAAYARRVTDCTREQWEAAYRAQRDERSTEGRRRRAGGHGYSGGDGFAEV